MATLKKNTKVLFGFTSPRTIEKIIPEIKLLGEKFLGKKWIGNEKLQIKFFDELLKTADYKAGKYPKDPALAARDRITRAPKALGFVSLDPKISLTNQGQNLISKKEIEVVISEQLLKFQLPSPFHKASNARFYVRPYLELLRMIYDLDGLSKTEIALFFLQLTNFKKYNVIKKKVLLFRVNKKQAKGNKKKFVESVISSELADIYKTELTTGDVKIRQGTKSQSVRRFISTKFRNHIDYADAYIRYLRASGLATFNSKTNRLVASRVNLDYVEYILKNVERDPVHINDSAKYKDYLYNSKQIRLPYFDIAWLRQKAITIGVQEDKISSDATEVYSTIQAKIFSAKDKAIAEVKEIKRKDKGIGEIVELFEKIKKKDREIYDPSLFFEWNVWRSMVALNYLKCSMPNFSMDIDGEPISTAPGGKPDIELEYEGFKLIVEVTLSTGNTQYNMEGESVTRHYGKERKETIKDLYCLFVAPKISESCAQYYLVSNKTAFAANGGKTKIIGISTDKFIEFVQSGIKNGFSSPAVLKKWLDWCYSECERTDDALQWINEIEQSCTKWAI